MFQECKVLTVYVQGINKKLDGLEIFADWIVD